MLEMNMGGGMGTDGQFAFCRFIFLDFSEIYVIILMQ
jgi:hypothetical protein